MIWFPPEFRGWRGISTMKEASTEWPPVLVAEDCPCVSQLLKLFLEDAGYQVSTAESVAEAVEIARRRPIRLLVSDFRLQDGTAWELMHRLSEVRPVRGIVISGYSDQICKDKSAEAGFSEYLVKPVEQDELVSAVGKLLEEQIRS